MTQFQSLEEALTAISAKCNYISFQKYEPINGYYAIEIVLSDVENVTVCEHIEDIVARLGEVYDAL